MGERAGGGEGDVQRCEFALVFSVKVPHGEGTIVITLSLQDGTVDDEEVLLKSNRPPLLVFMYIHVLLYPSASLK